ncbi:phosphate-selective porin O and P [Candidatus Nitrosoglobus terrae]|uniref:Phosphate-selective porin O and P n=2 Tax=Candidatus Nitrosoglobus terrae TaxID=1630141 RepID=A0A1Q2SMT3_9GAMM|nr:phosphate-selective porin O and P [Candidatus Nitrosoglobus terrae]
MKKFQWLVVFILSVSKVSWSRDLFIEEHLKEKAQKNQTKEQIKKPYRESTQQSTPKTSTISVGENGIVIRSADEAFKVRFGITLEMDGRFFLDHNTPNLEELRRARPIIEGILFRYFNFRLAPDVGQNRKIFADGYLGFNYWPQFRIQAGKFRPPLGLEMQQPASETLFIERGLPSDLVYNRNIGAQFYGDALENRLEYHLGLFRGARDNTPVTDLEEADGIDFIARVFSHPFINHSTNWLKGLGVGIAGSYGDIRGALSSLRIPSQGVGGINFFTYNKGVISAGERYIITPQLYYTWKSFRLLGDYIYSSREVQSKNNLGTIGYRAWQLAASYVLTGEKTVYLKRVRPRQSINPAQGAWGAFEIKARYDELYIDRGAFPVFANPIKSAHSAKSWTVGINWYLTPNIETELEYQQGYFKGGAITGDMPSERLIMARLQFAF